MLTHNRALDCTEAFEHVRTGLFGWTFCPGDKVMQVEDDYDTEVYNGDLGVVSRIDMDAGELTFDFDGRDVVYGFGELDELVLAYATTIHKSQGSEFPAVVIPLTTHHYTMLQRNLVYTGVTRGKRLVVLVGQRKALAIAVKGARARSRWSKVRGWLLERDGIPDEQSGVQSNASQKLTDIYVDADACPVREEIDRVAARLQLNVFVVFNGSRPIGPPGSSNVHMVLVGDTADAADDWIAEHISAADVCVTSDIPLASRCLKQGARVVSSTSRQWTRANIGNFVGR